MIPSTQHDMGCNANCNKNNNALNRISEPFRATAWPGTTAHVKIDKFFKSTFTRIKMNKNDMRVEIEFATRLRLALIRRIGYGGENEGTRRRVAAVFSISQRCNPRVQLTSIISSY